MTLAEVGEKFGWGFNGNEITEGDIEQISNAIVTGGLAEGESELNETTMLKYQQQYIENLRNDDFVLVQAFIQNKVKKEALKGPQSNKKPQNDGQFPTLVNFRLNIVGS